MCAHSSCIWASILHIFCPSVCRSGYKRQKSFATYGCCHPCLIMKAIFIKNLINMIPNNKKLRYFDGQKKEFDCLDQTRGNNWASLYPILVLYYVEVKLYRIFQNGVIFGFMGIFIFSYLLVFSMNKLESVSININQKASLRQIINPVYILCFLYTKTLLFREGGIIEVVRYIPWMYIVIGNKDKSINKGAAQTFRLMAFKVTQDIYRIKA